MDAIDVHVHLESLAATGTQTDSDARKYFGETKVPRDPQGLAEYYRSRKMAFVVFSVDERLSGRPQVPNDEVAAFAAEHADVAIAFASIDPTRGPEGVREARRLVSSGLVHGLKLHPPMQQFFPNDRIAYPLYEVFAEAKLPVLFHTGHSGIGTGSPGGGGVRLKYGHPMPIDDVAVDFPDLPIIMAHPSFPWQDEAISICLHKPSVYIDLSGWSPKYFAPNLVQYANTLLKHKVLFGSDYPWIAPDRWLADLEKTAIREDVRPLILKDNAVRLFGLQPPPAERHAMTEFLELGDAIARMVHQGDRVALEGFTHLIPFAAGHEIIRQRIQDLTLIRMTPDLLYDQMIGSGLRAEARVLLGRKPRRRVAASAAGCGGTVVAASAGDRRTQSCGDGQRVRRRRQRHAVRVLSGLSGIGSRVGQPQHQVRTLPVHRRIARLRARASA